MMFKLGLALDLVEGGFLPPGLGCYHTKHLSHRYSENGLVDFKAIIIKFYCFCFGLLEQRDAPACTGSAAAAEIRVDDDDDWRSAA